jgi:hypothetical protein
MGFCRMRRRKGGSSAAPFPAPLSPADAASLASHPAVRKEIQPRNQNSSPGRQFGWCYQLRYCGIQISSVAGHAPTNGGEPTISITIDPCTTLCNCKLLILWSHPPGLNRRPADYESAALPTELSRLTRTAIYTSPSDRSNLSRPPRLETALCTAVDIVCNKSLAARAVPDGFPSRVSRLCEAR